MQKRDTTEAENQGDLGIHCIPGLGFIPNLNPSSSGSKGDASWSQSSQEVEEATPGCLLEEPRHQSATRIASQVPKRVGLGLTWNQVPAAGVGTLLPAEWGAQDAGAHHPITRGAQVEIGDREAVS